MSRIRIYKTKIVENIITSNFYLREIRYGTNIIGNATTNNFYLTNFLLQD